MKFLDVKTDFAFKKVFGSEESKDILISFLNATLDFENGESITGLTIVDPYQIPLIKGMKDTYVDVKAVLSNNRRVIIEMQVLNVEGFEKRVLYNAAKAYSSQLKKAEIFTGLEPIIALTITDFVMFEDIENITTYFKLIEKETLIQYSDDIELIFIELPKFTKGEKELNDIREKWIYFVKNAGTLEYIPKSLEGEKEIKRAFDIANTAGMSDEELDAQWKRHDFLYLQKNSLIYAEKKAREEGRQEGRKEGIKETARRLFKMGVEKEKIIEATGLTMEELERVDRTPEAGNRKK